MKHILGYMISILYFLFILEMKKILLYAVNIPYCGFNIKIQKYQVKFILYNI